jgi:hypothetical protein
VRPDGVELRRAADGGADAGPDELRRADDGRAEAGADTAPDALADGRADARANAEPDQVMATYAFARNGDDTTTMPRWRERCGRQCLGSVWSRFRDDLATMRDCDERCRDDLA